MENLAMTVTPINPMRIRRAREKVREALAELTAALEEAAGPGQKSRHRLFYTIDPRKRGEKEERGRESPVISLRNLWRAHSALARACRREFKSSIHAARALLAAMPRPSASNVRHLRILSFFKPRGQLAQTEIKTAR